MRRDGSGEVRAASFRRLRGPTYLAVIADEAEFWTTDEWSSNPIAKFWMRCGLVLQRRAGP